MLNIDSDDAVNAIIRIEHLDDEEYTQSHNLIFCTQKGVIKKTPLKAYANPRKVGVGAIIIREDDRVIDVCLTDGDSEVIMADKMGRAIRFHESQVREMGRMSTGVRGMTLADDCDDEIIGMITVPRDTDKTVMVVSSKGYGKRSVVDDYRITGRGGKGVKTLALTDKTGYLVAIKSVTDENDLVIINKSGITIRMPLTTVPVQGRATQGVKLIDLTKRGDVIASVCKVDSDPKEEDDEVGEEAISTNDE